MMKVLVRVAWVVCLLASVGFGQTPGVVVVGDVRFTMITPQCVRIEQGKSFVDDPSIVAVNRDARTSDFKLSHDGDTTVIQSTAMELRYTPNGKALSPQNLIVKIHMGTGGDSTWSPGTENTHNLGGTARTLDGWDGPRDLGEGLLSRDGWFLLDDSRSPLLTRDWVRARPEDAGTDWYLFAYGFDYRAALKSFTTFAGPVPMPRRYVLGAWYSRYWPYTSDEYRNIVKEYSEHDFPLDMLVLDMDWHRDGWTGYSWNRKLLPDVEALLKWVHEQGVHITLNDHPADGLKPHEDVYPAFMRAMGEDPDKKQTLPYDVGNQKYLTTFYDVVMKPLARDGCDFWWLDWQQYPKTRSIPDLTNLFWLNHFYYQQTSQDNLRGQCLTRWGGWGSHRYPIQFSGDASTNWRMLAAEVPFTSTAGNVGCFFWSHDIGGHMGRRNEESYVRWVQFGATTAALRSHSTRSAEMDRRPWMYPDWAEQSMRKSFHLRSTLMPYIYSAVRQSTRDSIPLDRPMYFDYPLEERAYHSPQEFLLGDHLLVAPVTSPGVGERRIATQAVWFPPGDRWFNLFTGESYVGGTEALVAAGIDEFPLYVRSGVPIAMRTYPSRMTTSPLDTLVVRAYPGEVGKMSTTTLYEDDGLTTAYRKGEAATTELSYHFDGSAVTISVAPTLGTYADQLKERSVVVELPATRKATSATVDGQDVATIAYDEATRTNRITLPAKSIRQATRVVVQVLPADPEEIARRARSERADIELAKTDVKSQLREALSRVTDATNRQILLASFGIGVIAKNENVYGYPEAGALTLYAPPTLVIDPAHPDQAKTGTAPVENLNGVMPTSPVRDTPATIALMTDGTRIDVQTPPLPINYATLEGNIAPRAHATASTATNESPAKGAIEGHVGGYPERRAEEWTTVSEKADATLTLRWDQPQKIDRVWLFDRQNTVDQVTAGELRFDDGDPVSFGELPNDARTGAVVSFPGRTTRSLTVHITKVRDKTENTGLAEIVVFRAAE